MQLRGKRLGFHTQTLIKQNKFSAAVPAVKDCAFWNRQIKHLFKGHRLRTELNSVTVTQLWLASLVLYGVGQNILAGMMKFNSISNADQSQVKRSNSDSVADSNHPSLLTASTVDAIVQQPSFRSLPVFKPQLLNMDQRTLSRAKCQVLKGG